MQALAAAQLDRARVPVGQLEPKAAEDCRMDPVALRGRTTAGLTHLRAGSRHPGLVRCVSAGVIMFAAPIPRTTNTVTRRCALRARASVIRSNRMDADAAATTRGPESPAP